jgi:hypothetical protein
MADNNIYVLLQLENSQIAVNVIRAALLALEAVKLVFLLG